MLRDLNIVGTGITAVSHMTMQAQAIIAACDEVFYVVTDPLIEDHLSSLNSRAQSLRGLYEEGKDRKITYREMSDALVASVKRGARTCGAFYGHPGVFVTPTFDAIRIVRELGYTAQMFPGISAEDCLFSDLEIDPGLSGCQSYEATGFLVFKKHVEIGAALILWQVGSIGDLKHTNEWDNSRGMAILQEYLEQYYPPDHKVAFYEAPLYAVIGPRIDWVSLSEIGDVECSGITTLFVPPLHTRRNLDLEMLEKLGITEEYRKIRQAEA